MDRYILTAIGVPFIVIAVVVFLILYLSEISCSASWKDSGMESRWSVMTDCQIKYNGQWIPASSFRAGDN